MIVYVSFLSRRHDILPSVAKAIANFNIITRAIGVAGTQPLSARQLVTENKEPCGVMVIPQAGLCAKLKGKAPRYRAVCKDIGMELCSEFCDLLKTEICASTPRKPASHESSKKKMWSVGPHVSPKVMFLDDLNYASWDRETGLPTHMADGETPVSKSKRKKLIKLQKAQEKRHKAYLADPDKYLKSVDEGAKAKAAIASAGAAEDDLAHSQYLTFIKGTFGNRQGLRVDASCGPFSHAFSFGAAN